MAGFRIMAALGLLLPGVVPFAHALDVTHPEWYRCEQGDCRNGTGRVYDVMQNQWIDGTWRGGQTIAGSTYWVSHPLTRGKRYEQVYGEDGRIVSGTTLRGIGAMGRAVPRFTGTYARVDHAFMRGARLAVPEEGVYDMGQGIEYRGRFDYVPAKGSEAGQITQGYFVFFGERVDTDDDSRESGLFVSDTAVVGGAPIRFVRARPDYMLVLQQQYQRDLMIAADDFQRQDGQKVWRMALAVLGEVSLSMAGGRAGGTGGLGASSGGGSAGNRFAMELVSGLIKGTPPQAGATTPAAGGGDASTQFIRLLTGAALGKATGDKALAEQLSGAIATGIEKGSATSGR